MTVDKIIRCGRLKTAHLNLIELRTESMRIVLLKPDIKIVGTVHSRWQTALQLTCKAGEKTKL